MRITPDTLCDSKLHHHGNHYQENWVIRECLEVVGDRSVQLQRDTEKRQRSSRPEGRKTATLHSNSIDLIQALLFELSHRDTQTSRGRVRNGERIDFMKFQNYINNSIEWPKSYSIFYKAQLLLLFVVKRWNNTEKLIIVSTFLLANSLDFNAIGFKLD